MNSDPRNAPVRQITVVLDHRSRGADTLAGAAALARRTQSRVRVIFVEDENLLRVANLPFAHEINRTTGLVNSFDQSDLARRNARQIEQLGSLVSKLISAAQLTGAVQVVRGKLTEHALAASGQADVVFFSGQTQLPGLTRRALSALGHDTDSHADTPVAPKPIAIIFDGSDASVRALGVAKELSAAADSGLVVAVQSDSGLQERAAQILGQPRIRVRFANQTIQDAAAVNTLVHGSRCATLVVPVHCSVLAGQERTGLLELFNCPVVLIR